MKPIIQLAETRTPGGKRLVLSQHDGAYSLVTDGLPLMTSREHESELALARLGCAHIVSKPAPHVLIGGLGLGFTLRQTLDMLQPGAHVVVAELLPDVVEWNRTTLGELTGHALDDSRVAVHVGDVVDIVREVEQPFDAILIDIDNGPEAISDDHDHPLYGREGLQRVVQAMTPQGCLAIWSAGIDQRFERRVRGQGLQAKAVQVPAYKGAKARSKCIWVVTPSTSART